MTTQLDLLSEHQLIELTGYQRPTDQMRVLREHGIFYIERRDGTVAVTLHAVHYPSGQTTADAGINFGAIT